MALGGIILYIPLGGGASGVVADPARFLNANDPFTLELRVRFPKSTNEDLTPTFLSATLVTLTTGSLSSFFSIWYEKTSAASMTGNIFVTSSAGKLQLTSASIFDDRFYNLSFVKEHRTGSATLSLRRYDDGELKLLTSSVAMSSSAGYPVDAYYSEAHIGSWNVVPSTGQFWAQEFRLWRAALTDAELDAHASHFESYGRDVSYDNRDLLMHWRLSDGAGADSVGKIFVMDSVPSGALGFPGTGSNFLANVNPYDKFLLDYAYVPSYDYGWNQKKIRVYDDYKISRFDAYRDEPFVSLEMNMVDALNEDITHMMTSYDELNDVIGLPINRNRPDYAGLQQMRETYFKRLQGRLNFRVFADMLDYFDRSFVSMVERLLPARAAFKGDEFIVESHMLERSKMTYNARPMIESQFIVSGTIQVLDRTNG